MKRLKLDLNIGIESLDVVARNTVTTHYLGSYKSIFKGRGLEFDSYRRYAPEDNADTIDWKASAKTGELMVKQYTEERNLNIFFLIDVSNTMILSSQPKLKCEYAAEMVAALSYSILKAGDNVGYALFNEGIIDYIRCTKGTGTYSQLIDTLSQTSKYGGGYDLKKALEFALETLEEGTLLIIVSDFIGLSKDWEESIKLAGTKFQLIGMMVVDPIDRKIPEGMGQIAIADPLSGDRLLVDTNLIKPHYEAEVKRIEDDLNSAFTNINGDFVILETNHDFLGKIIELFRMRQFRYR